MEPPDSVLVICSSGRNFNTVMNYLKNKFDTPHFEVMVTSNNQNQLHRFVEPDAVHQVSVPRFSPDHISVDLLRRLRQKGYDLCVPLYYGVDSEEYLNVEATALAIKPDRIVGMDGSINRFRITQFSFYAKKIRKFCSPLVSTIIVILLSVLFLPVAVLRDFARCFKDLAEPRIT